MRALRVLGMRQMKPRLLDLFCGAGGAAVGYQRAGFDEIVGVDHRPQPRYPFTFVEADALEYLAAHGPEFDAIHASPPCQGYSIMRNLPWLREREYPLLIEPTRELLQDSGRRWVIENVMGARLPAGWLCGQMFGLPFFRHRYFLSGGGFFWLAPPHPRHRATVRSGRTLGSRARDIVAVPRKGLQEHFKRNGAQKMGANIGHAAGAQLVREAMQIEWMSRDEITQAVPPAYTEFIGRQLLASLQFRDGER